MNNDKSKRKKLSVIKTDAYNKPSRNKKKKIIKKDYKESERKNHKQQIKWNIEVYDLVYVGSMGIGIVVSNKEYQNRYVETDKYFVYVNDSVIQVLGNHIRKIN